MRISDSILLDLLDKLRCWISRGMASGSDSSMLGSKMYCEHNSVVGDHMPRYHCLGCDRFLCAKCVQGTVTMEVVGPEKGHGVGSIKGCKFCGEVSSRTGVLKKNSEKVHPRNSPDPPSPCFSGLENVDESMINTGSIQRNYLQAEEHVYSPHESIASDFSARPSPVSVRCSPNRCKSDEEEAGNSGKPYSSPSSGSFRCISDIDTRRLRFRHDFYSFKSGGSTPSDSPSRNHFSLNRGGHFVQHEQGESPVSLDGGPFSQEETMAVLIRPGAGTEDAESTDYCLDDLSIFSNKYDRFQKSLDFQNNDLIWFPPLPYDEKDETEGNYFEYDDDDDYVGDSGTAFTPSTGLSCIFSAKDRQHEGNKEPIRALVQGHFRALVSQLLYSEGIKMGEENGPEQWVDIVTNLAWQAASFVKPDTSRGGSMDPCDYVKIKCVASGSPSESALVKGIVCTKNVKHKRMTSQYKTPRLLILGGALEYQRVPNQLASFDTLLQQEIDHLKMIISKIEALHPNVLLVEKSVSSYAQEYLLAKEISLVLNVKRPLLERISRCTGAAITPSTDGISSTRLGHCELFKLERVSEELEVNNQSSRKPSKTLMYFEGCPRRLGCTVLLRGAIRDELKKVKHVVQYAVFAAYHLSLETSFLADEGATLPTKPLNPSGDSERIVSDIHCSAVSNSASHSIPGVMADTCNNDEVYVADSELLDPRIASLASDAYEGHVCHIDIFESKDSDILPSSETRNDPLPEHTVSVGREGEYDVTSEYFSADTNQSILVSFSSRCVLKRTVCERSRLLRIKFYGCFDKPLGRYLRDDLFDQTSYCRSCKEPAEAHVLCYTHQQGNLTVNVKRIPSLRLPGEQDGKIWMWHRCLKCGHDANGVPPATRRVVMSDAAWGLSFGKFLELSFSNHATANRVATCGHSLQRDCLRYYGFGNMVAFFRYSPIDILSVFLPPSVLDFNSDVHQKWLKKEAVELMDKMEALYQEISGLLDAIEQRSCISGKEFVVTHELQNYILELKHLLQKERTDYNDLFKAAIGPQLAQSVDILELNHLQRSLVIGSHVWDRRLYSLDLLLESNSPKSKKAAALCSELRELSITSASSVSELLNLTGSSVSGSQSDTKEDLLSEGETDSDFVPSGEPNLSERIDSAWTGSDHVLPGDCLTGGPLGPAAGTDGSSFRRLMAPIRVNSFDSALKIREKMQRGHAPSSLHLANIRSFHASGDYRNMVRDPVSNMTRTYSQMLPRDSQKLSLSMLSSGSHLAVGAHLLLTQAENDIVIAVYDDEPTSIISYALCSKEHEDWVSIKSDEQGHDWNGIEGQRDNISAASSFSSLPSFGALDMDHINGFNSFTSEDVTQSSVGSLFRDPKKSSHLRISFENESPSSAGKIKFSVTCYFGKQFESLRRKCCPSELDIVRSLSRCRRWSAQGGKSNVYFAKSIDERFIIKQVTKTELDSFEDFASEYFKYLNDSLSSGSPTCLAKILGLYQVSVKHPRGGKETKMDLMVMENLFFKRRISRVYDLKGSNRARYNPDTTGKDKVLLDMNLLETLRTQPIFLGSKAKRSLERAIWNDTSFLASVDVMDYSLLVGVDEESKELVLGIIDFMRQYTWDKHLETWVKASGILGGPKNASPTIISPMQYKKRFRKAMTAYFLTVPDQWSS